MYDVRAERGNVEKLMRFEDKHCTDICHIADRWREGEEGPKIRKLGNVLHGSPSAPTLHLLFSAARPRGEFI